MNKIKSILLGLLLSTSVGAQNITMNVHNVALAEVLYELAEAAQLNLVLSHGLDFDISVVLQDVDARTGLTLVCKSVAVDCQYTQQGLVVGEATDQSNTQILPLHVVKLNYGEADSIMLALQSGQTMLSAKGQLLADNRSQQIFVYDDNAHAASLVEAIKLLDQPLAQILIEGRIVIAKSSLGQSSGLDFIGRLGPKAKAADSSGGSLELYLTS